MKKKVYTSSFGHFLEAFQRESARPTHSRENENLGSFGTFLQVMREAETKQFNFKS